MATTSTENFSDLHERILRFMGAFSSTQSSIDNVVEIYLTRRLPKLGKTLATQFLRKTRDDQRLPLFNAYAAETQYDGDLSHFDPIYLRAKQVRDLIGHSIHISGPVSDPKYSSPVVSITRASAFNDRLVPEPVMPSTFDRLTTDCEWISQHVWYAAYLAEPEAFISTGPEPYDPPKPALLPDGGEPNA